MKFKRAISVAAKTEKLRRMQSTAVLSLIYPCFDLIDICRVTRRIATRRLICYDAFKLTFRFLVACLLKKSKSQFKYIITYQTTRRDSTRNSACVDETKTWIN